MRLVRTLIVLGAAGLFLPSPPEDRQAPPAPGAPSTLDVLSSAGSAAADAWAFCGRQREVCEVAGYLAGRLEAKTLYSASLLWGWAWDGHTAAAKGDGPFAAISVEGDMPKAAPGAAAGSSTLNLDDLVPAWRGPAKDG